MHGSIGEDNFRLHRQLHPLPSKQPFAHPQNRVNRPRAHNRADKTPPHPDIQSTRIDRKSVVEGKSVDIGGWRIIKKKKKKKRQMRLKYMKKSTRDESHESVISVH